MSARHHKPTDTYSVMLQACREWLREHHPESRYATLVVDMGNDELPKTHEVISSVSSASPDDLLAHQS